MYKLVATDRFHIWIVMVILGFFKHKKQSGKPEKKSYSSLEWPDYVLTLDRNNFDNFIKKYPLSVVDFWAPWCGPCKTMGHG